MGSATLEIAILGPALLFLIFAIIEGALWFYARNLALAAAQEGVETGRSFGSTPDAGVRRANAFLTRSASDSLMATSVTSTGTTTTTIRIQVKGRALSLFPGVPGIPVSQSAEGPIERFTVAAP